MNIKGSKVLVTGANRGLGLAFTRALKARGATAIYGGARDAKTITEPGVTPVALDVTDAAQVAAAAEQLGDVDLVINNAGIVKYATIADHDVVATARAQLETNFIAPLALSHAFAPVLARNGGGAIVNVLSVLSWLSGPRTLGYGASKAAAWSLTNGLRHSLNAQGTQVVGVHVGWIDTDMAAHVTGPKVSADEVVAKVLDALERGEHEVLVDDVSRQVHDNLSRGSYTIDPTAPRPPAARA